MHLFFPSFGFVPEFWVSCRVLGFHRLITFQHSTHTPRCSTLTPRFFVYEFSGTIFPWTIFLGTIFPGDHFSKDHFSGIIFTHVISLFFWFKTYWKKIIICFSHGDIERILISRELTEVLISMQSSVVIRQCLLK